MHKAKAVVMAASVVATRGRITDLAAVALGGPVSGKDEVEVPERDLRRSEGSRSVEAERVRIRGGAMVASLTWPVG
jgi:ApbE superfamily uncharacterized protein (UPF0280 family)